MAIQQQKLVQDLRVLTTDDADKEIIRNIPAKGVPYFNPEQTPAPGTGLRHGNGFLPKLFTPIMIRGIEMPNRIWVSPMCQYSARDGFQQPWHFAHYGGMAQRGVRIIPFPSPYSFTI